MQLSLIVAMSTNRVIGIQNQLPWHLPADLKHFKQLTLGKPVIMGRKTYDSIGKPLPNRCNIVVSRNQSLQIPGCEVVNSLESALKLVATAAEVMIIGGEQLFTQALPLADRLYLTLIHQQIPGDSFFPLDIETSDQWQLVIQEDHLPDAQNPYPFSFLTFDKTR